MKLEIIQKSDLIRFKSDMQQAFQLGAVEGGLPVDGEIILPESHIDSSLKKSGSTAYKAVAGGQIAGGAIIVTKENKGYLDFLYVKHDRQGRGVGKFIWNEIEKLHPEITVWETCTPYFDRRNIHFYINVCGFHAVEYFNSHHPDPNDPEDYNGEEDFGMFAFRKIISG